MIEPRNKRQRIDSLQSLNNSQILRDISNKTQTVQFKKITQSSTTYKKNNQGSNQFFKSIGSKRSRLEDFENSTSHQREFSTQRTENFLTTQSKRAKLEQTN